MEVGARDVQGLPPWHGQPLDRVTPPWLANQRPPAMSPHAKPKGPPSWIPSSERRGSWLGEAWAPIHQTRGHPPMLRIKKHTKAKQDPSAKRTTPTPHKCHKCCQTPPTTNPTPLNTSNSVNATRVQPQCPINAINTLNATKMTGPNAS